MSERKHATGEHDRRWVRAPAVAGLFYPADPDALERAVAGYVEQVPPSDEAGAPKAVIAPHAGYVYSGPVAATAYARVGRGRGVVRRVLLAGPAHRVAVHGVAVTSAAAFETPLGPVAVDDEARRLALAVPGVAVNDDAHAGEHSLEVHLPFLQWALGAFTVLPLVTGGDGPPVLAAVLDALWGGPETLIVISTDLSHYHDDATAKRLDRRTADAIVGGRGGEIGPMQACGAAPVRGLLEAAAARGLAPALLDLRTSADTAGRPDRVVGYGAFELA